MDPLDHIIVGGLVLVRVMAMLLTAPVLGSRSVPLRFRVVLGIALAAMTLPLVLAHPQSVPDLRSLPASLACEIAIGISLGLGVTLVYSAAQMAGNAIAQMAAIPLLDTASPAGQGSAVGQLFGILAAAAFTLMNGPELLITTTLDTFTTLPLGSSLNTDSLADLVVELLRQSFLLTLRGVAPAVTAMLISTVTIGLISRSFPEINLVTLGLTSNLSVMLLALFFTLGGCVWMFADDLPQVLTTIENGLASGSNSTSGEIR